MLETIFSHDSLGAGEAISSQDYVHGRPGPCRVHVAWIRRQQIVQSARHVQRGARPQTRRRMMACGLNAASNRLPRLPCGFLSFGAERTVPQPIIVAAFTGVERLSRIDFDLALVPSFTRRLSTETCNFRSEVGRIPETLSAFRSISWGIVNHISDRAIQFDLDGKPLVILPHAPRPGGYLHRALPPTDPAGNAASVAWQWLHF
jgi:hypothetical protein